MNVFVNKTTALKGAVYLPASKSYSIRAFMIALCGGTSIIENPSDCDDAVVARNVAKQFGAKLVKLRSNDWRLTAKANSSRLTNINVGESGTVLRFVLPLAALHGKKSLIKGIGTLRGRPNAFLTQTLRQMGVAIQGQGKVESVPIRIDGGQIRGGSVKIDGSISSQFISALLIACPQLVDDVSLNLTGKKLVSLDYIIMTLQVLKETGVKIKQSSPRRFYIPGNQTFRGLKKFVVPSDLGLAAFLLAAGILTESNLVLNGALSERFIQADGHILPLLKRMRIKFTKTSKAIRIKGPQKIKGGQFSLKNCPDLLPIMAVLSLFADKKVRLYDIGHARVKESDRISDLRHELLKIGADVKETKNELFIQPKDAYKTDRWLNSHHDHRLAMAFAVLGLRIGVKIKDMQSMSKSYPGFLKDILALGADAKRI
ncbi:MAG: 3-phosphoshikimate 1-carboxyvinyltransferase [Candidatus Omnitrophica bacterium]|nr:3-phosphoshikimate 1-carboxyvinyltransferase [Candidatus Omnitrophota bacterium]